MPSSILAIHSLSYRREEMCDCLLFLLGTFLPFQISGRYFFCGGGVCCDTSSVIVATTIFLHYLYNVIYSVTWFKFELLLNQVLIATCKETSNF
jgi:hypothetical protein